jgi:phospholipase/carboxylesterase
VSGAGRFALARPATGPHAEQPVLYAGPALAEARAVVIAVHGRGDGAEGILAMRDMLGAPDIGFVAPHAAGNTWYPYAFLAPTADNEPWLSSALDVLRAVVETLESAGVRRRRIVPLGFSQGGCLALHFAATHATRWGGLVGLSAGLIGPPDTKWTFKGSLAGTPAFLGCSDPDPHIPRERLEDSARVLEKLGAAVTLRVYPKMGHTVNEDELEHVRRLLRSVEGAKKTK